jgi:hypothetical protein
MDLVLYSYMSELGLEWGLGPTKSEDILNNIKCHIADNTQKSIQPIIDQLLRRVDDAKMNFGDMRVQAEEKIDRKLYIAVRNLIKPWRRVYLDILDIL